MIVIVVFLSHCFPFLTGFSLERLISLPPFTYQKFKLLLIRNELLTPPTPGGKKKKNQ